MQPDDSLGQIIVLNGAPRSGKSSIAAAIQDTFDGVWMSMGVDAFMAMTPERFQPGLGLRPGGERPDLEPLVAAQYRALYESIAALSRQGLNVVADVGHHDNHSKPLGILPACAKLLDGLPALFVGVRCPTPIIMERRIATWGQSYEDDGSTPEAIQRFQRDVHNPGIYDLEVDTSMRTPTQCAEIIRRQLAEGPPPTAFAHLADLV